MSKSASDHHHAVASWLSRSQRRSAPELVDAFEQVFAALWQRSHLTLGEVTLTAIVDRVLHGAKEQFDVLASVEVDGTGLSCAALRAQKSLDVEQLSTGFELVLVEFLTVLGNLTAEILTPALHAELLKAAAPRDPDTSQDDASS